jgi:hypothetical protein
LRGQLYVPVSLPGVLLSTVCGDCQLLQKLCKQEKPLAPQYLPTRFPIPLSCGRHGDRPADGDVGRRGTAQLPGRGRSVDLPFEDLLSSLDKAPQRTYDVVESNDYCD